MGRKKSTVPAYLLHAPSGQARMIWNGKTHYLGRHGSPGSHELYQRYIAEIQAHGRVIDNETAEITLSECIERFLWWCTKNYGPGSKEPLYHAYALEDFKILYGALAINRVSPTEIRTVRAKWEQECRWSRKTINKRVRQFIRFLGWCVEEKLCKPDTWQAARAVRPLSIGRTAAAEYQQIGPVSERDLQATLARLNPVTADMVRVQWLLACRPGELVTMRSSEIDTSGPVWKWTLKAHKTAFHGIGRDIAIGPRAQEVVARHMQANASRSDHRVFPRHKTVDTYRQAIFRAACRAGVAPWHPNQLRHARATDLTDKYGLTAAQAVLGHTDPKTTMTYNKAAWKLSARIAEEIG